MKEDRPSFTAAYVATARALGSLLPPEARLCEDRFGAAFAGQTIVAAVRRLEVGPAIARRAALHVPGVLRNVLWLQLRTRVVDDELRSFVEAGGRQVVLLGAGFDCRAARLCRALAGSVVFEVDHPATQAKKRKVLGGLGAESADVAYVAWDFERDAMEKLPARLAESGHDHALPTLTVWEGVTMYLTPPAIEAAVAAVRAYSGKGSRLAFTYFDRAVVEHPPLARRLAGHVVARAGEPFRFGWAPEELPAWLAARGFQLRADGVDTELAARLLPLGYAQRVGTRGNHVAVAETVDG